MVFREEDEGLDLLQVCGILVAAVHNLWQLKPAVPVELACRTLRKRQNLDQAAKNKSVFL